MKKTLHKLLQLQSLTLLQRGLNLPGASVKKQRVAELESRINRLRHQVPGAALARFDAAAGKFSDPMIPVSRGGCGSCNAELPARLPRDLKERMEWAECPSCGRLLYLIERAPRFVTVSDYRGPG